MTDHTGPAPEIQAAPHELVALAKAVRPAWDHDILAAAILAARNAGWTWARTLTETVRLMNDPDGTPWDLKRACADPFKHTVPAPGTEKRGAALARKLMGLGADRVVALAAFAVIAAGVAWLALNNGWTATP